MSQSKRPRLSVILICKNEAAHIDACLKSVAFADEIIVLDSGSEDATLELARQHSDKVFSNDDWQGFGVQKNRALALASGDWVLSIDADERVEAALAQAIMAHMDAHPKLEVAARFPRANYFLGKRIRHSGWSPDYVLRLAPREQMCFNDVKVHESVQFAGPIATLNASLTHYSYDNYEQVLSKMNQYSSEWARDQKPQKSSSTAIAVGRGFFAFLRAYILRLGVLDGRAGLVLALCSGQSALYKYLKLQHLRDTESSSRHE